MPTLWLDHRDLELRLEPGALVPYVAGRRQRPVPLRLLERVIIVGNCHLSTSVLTGLAEAGVSVAMLSPRKSGRRAWLIGPGHNDVSLRLQQLAAAADPVFRQTEAHRLVLAKVRRQLTLVEDMRAKRPDAGVALKRAADIIGGILASLKAAGPEGLALEALRGLEGSASRAGFEALAAVLPLSLGFAGRRRRPPPDPVNAVLSLSYVLLHHRAVQVAWAHGLEPLLGFFHEPSHGRESLAADLIEPWRPEVDRWVWRLFAEQRLRPVHFHGKKALASDDTAMPTVATDAAAQEVPARRDAGPCYLGKAGRRIFYEAFEQDLAPLFRALRLQVRGLVRRIRAHAARATLGNDEVGRKICGHDSEDLA